MIRTASKPYPVASFRVAIFALAVFMPVCAWAGGPGTLPAAKTSVNASGAPPVNDDDEGDASPLVVMNDFNRDGIPDIAQATLPAKGHTGPATLTMSLGQTDGSFKQVASKPIFDHAPRSIVTGDFNGDGIPDLIVGDDDGALQLFFGDGTGNMVRKGDAAHLDSVVSIAVADFNHDGISDIAVSDWRASAVTVFLGSGNGSFHYEESFPLRMRGTVPHLSAADFNGDGNTDLAVVYDSDDGDTFEVMLGNGHGVFTDAPELSVVRDPNAHCAT